LSIVRFLEGAHVRVGVIREVIGENLGHLVEKHRATLSNDLVSLVRGALQLFEQRGVHDVEDAPVGG
jgi:hypothetical protein